MNPFSLCTCGMGRWATSHWGLPRVLKIRVKLSGGEEDVPEGDWTRKRQRRVFGVGLGLVSEYVDGFRRRRRRQRGAAGEWGQWRGRVVGKG